MAVPACDTWSSQPWYHKVAMVLLAPFVFASLLFVLPVILIMLVPIGIYGYGRYFYGLWRMRSDLRRQGRLLRLPEARARITKETGTLIIENPSLGWNMTHAWWTPDDLLGQSPFAVPTDSDYKLAAKTGRCTDWDKWCWENYTSPEGGRALLVRLHNGRSLEAVLGADFPWLKVVHTWTALVHCERPMNDTSSSN